jgi:hypothetical protein
VGTAVGGIVVGGTVVAGIDVIVDCGLGKVVGNRAGIAAAGDGEGIGEDGVNSGRDVEPGMDVGIDIVAGGNGVEGTSAQADKANNKIVKAGTDLSFITSSSK